MDTPHNFDSHSRAHMIAALLCDDHDIDPGRVIYKPERAEMPAGVVIATHPRTWCHMIDADNGSLYWRISIETGNTQTGSNIIEAAYGEINTAQITRSVATDTLAEIIEHIKYVG